MSDRIVSDGLLYDPAVGVFIWLTPKCYRMKVGDIAGSRDAYGYRKIKWLGKSVFAHRLAWFLVFGEWPSEQIDHVNGDKSDNRLENLREATRAQNAANRAGWRDGLKGAAPCKDRWSAGIKVGGRRKHLGCFATELEAHEAYVQAAASVHGEFSNAKSGASSKHGEVA